MNLTNQQISIVKACLSGNHKLVKINAVSGAGKTATLVEVSNALINHRGSQLSGQYLAYNKSISEEASLKFPKSISCNTVHSMAYQNTVNSKQINFNLVVGQFKPKDIKERMAYERKCLLHGYIEEFFLSSFLAFKDFGLQEYVQLDLKEISLCEKYINKMKDGVIECTHGFYLKLYHMLIANKILIPAELDLLMLDEAGDTNAVILEVFRILPAKLKIMVGDVQQNIYSFNNTINGFKVMENEGISLELSQSFRVADYIAEAVKSFSDVYLEEDMSFQGMNYQSVPAIKSSAFIARTNSTLVGAMIEMNRSRTPYNITRSAGQIFQLPLILLNLKPNAPIWDPAYKFLEEDANHYFESQELQHEYSSVIGYVKSVHSDDIGISSACNIIVKYGPSAIYSAYADAKKHQAGDTKHKVTLTTAHSSKGLEWDEVTLMTDMNDKLTDVLEKYTQKKEQTGIPFYDLMSNESQEEFRLYYVACTRARYQLHQADHLIGGYDAPESVESIRDNISRYR